MKNLTLFIILLVSPFFLNAQAINNQCNWSGGGADTNWTTTANWTGNNCVNGYPSGTAAVALIQSANTTITLDADIELKQIKIGGTAGEDNVYTITTTAGQNYTLLISGSGVSQPIQINKKGNEFVFNCNVTHDNTAGGTKTINLNAGVSTSGKYIKLTHGEGYTLKVDDHITFQSNSKFHEVYLNGTISSTSGLTKDMKFTDKHKLYFGANVNMTNFGGDLWFTGSNESSTGVTVNGAVKARQLAFEDDAFMVINTSGSVTATSSTVTTGGNSFIRVKTSNTASGTFIAKLGTGDINLQFVKTLDADGEWTLIGVPVTGETVADVDDNLLTQGGNSAIATYDNSAGDYAHFSTNANTALVAGTGYAIAPTGSGTVDVTFTGTMSTAGTVTAAVSRDASVADNKGWWNLLGNPYPSYLMMTDNTDSASDSFLEINKGNIHNSYEAVYAWDGAAWDVYNKTTNTINHIAPGEGFFIYFRNTDDAATINFKEAMQKVSKGANFNAGLAGGNSNSRIAIFEVKIDDLENDQSDNINLYFSDKTTKGLDPGYDAGKFFMGSESKLFTRLLDGDEGIDFQIQALPFDQLNNLVVPLGITTSSSKLKLSVADSSIDNFINIFLEDKLNNTIVEFDKPIDLEFSNDESSVGRFFLHFTDELIPELPTDKDLRIFKVSDNEIKIMGDPTKSYSAEIYDFSGRLINNVTFKHKINVSDLKKGIKILKIKSDDNVNVIKKFKLN